MLRPQPTRIELKHDDMKELQLLKQKQKSLRYYHQQQQQQQQLLQQQTLQSNISNINMDTTNKTVLASQTPDPKSVAARIGLVSDQ